MEEIFIKSELVEVEIKGEPHEESPSISSQYHVKSENLDVERNNYIDVDIHDYNAIQDSHRENFFNDASLKSSVVEPYAAPIFVNPFQLPPEVQGPSQNTDVIGKVYENGKINRLNCSQCPKTFKNRANLKNHMKYVHCDEQNIECKECFRTFKSILYLRSHMSSVHAKTEEVKCQHCDKIFMNKKKLNNHIYYTHRQPEEEVACKICAKTYKSSYNLKVHMRYVHPEGDPHPCPFCYKTFKVEMLLQRHMKWAHPSDGLIYKCRDCNKILPSMDCYRIHIKNVHHFVRVTCDVCKRSYKTKKSLERHLKRDHSGNERERESDRMYIQGDFTCQYCERTFINNTSLFWHIERNHNEISSNLPNNVCIICNKEFSDYAALHRHLTSVHSLETAVCKLCSKEFKSPINLQNHIRITHASPEARQTCEACQKTFKCSLHLRMHMLAVHADGEFPCDICQKTFSSTKYLNKHKKSHDDSRDFQCDICLKMYKNVNAVKKHKKQVHEGVKCNVCNIKQININDHIQKCHPEYVPNASDMLKIEELPCKKCGEFISVVDFNNHEMNCEGRPIFEVTIKTEVVEDT